MAKRVDNCSLIHALGLNVDNPVGGSGGVLAEGPDLCEDLRRSQVFVLDNTEMMPVGPMS